MAAKFFTGLPLDGPDPECVHGHGERALATADTAAAPRPAGDHSHRTRRGPVPLTLSRRGRRAGQPPVSACNAEPAGRVRAAGALTSRLADLSWPEIGQRAAAGAVLAVPVGSTEQHGPHLPLSTDTDIAVALCDRLAAARPDVLVAPPVALRVQRRARRVRRARCRSARARWNCS